MVSVAGNVPRFADQILQLESLYSKQEVVKTQLTPILQYILVNILYLQWTLATAGRLELHALLMAFDDVIFNNIIWIIFAGELILFILFYVVWLAYKKTFALIILRFMILKWYYNVI